MQNKNLEHDQNIEIRRINSEYLESRLWGIWSFYGESGVGLGPYFTPPRFTAIQIGNQIYICFFSRTTFIYVFSWVSKMEPLVAISVYLSLFSRAWVSLFGKTPPRKILKQLHTVCIPMYVCSTPYVFTERVHMGIFQKVRWTVHLTGHLGYFLILCHMFYTYRSVSGNPGKTRAAK